MVHQTAIHVAIFVFILSISSISSNNSPIIGIFSQPLSNHGDYIAASYVKWVEMAGGRVVPIPYRASNDTIKKIFSSINGLLFPGGGAHVNSQAAYFVKLALEANDLGDYFPVWGTCLGLEWLVEITSENNSILSGYDAWNISLPLIFTPKATGSKLFRNIPKDIMENLFNHNLTMNNHHQGITPHEFTTNSKLNAFYDILSTSSDRSNIPFVSAFEAKQYPIYGVQFHPEKSIFEWGKENNYFFEAINHSSEAIAMSQYFANFFISEARKNIKHKFSNAEMEKQALIYNYNTSDILYPDFVQAYLFEKSERNDYWSASSLAKQE